MSERYVVDASMVIKLFVEEEFSQTTRKVFERLGSSDPDEFYVPDLLFAECANVLWKYVRFHGYDREIAREHLADLAELAFHVVPIIELIKESFEIANRHAITVYDACYVALAEVVNASLITADEKLVARLSGQACL